MSWVSWIGLIVILPWLAFGGFILLIVLLGFFAYLFDKEIRK